VAARLGQVLYWGASALAVVAALTGLWAAGTVQGAYAYGQAMLAVAIAALIWLLGRAVLYVLAGK